MNPLHSFLSPTASRTDKPKIPSFVWLCINLFIGFSCNDKTETTTPTRTHLVESVYASGFVKSEGQYEVFAKSPGKIENILVQEGDSIRVGDPLFQLERNKAQLSTALARETARANDLQQMKAKLFEAKQAIEVAHKKWSLDSLGLARQQALAQQNIGTKVELEQKALNFENAKINLQRAQVTYQDLQRQLKLAAAQSNTNLQLAQATENDYLIRSELTGRVYQINVKKGEFTTGQQPLAVVGQANYLIEFLVDEMDIVKIQLGQKVVLRLDSYPNEVFEAQVSFIYPIMDERKRAFRVEGRFTKAPPVLYPNLSLEANVILQERNSVLTIPSQYLLNDTSVVLEDGSIRRIEVGLKESNFVEVRRGLDENTQIRLPKK